MSDTGSENDTTGGSGGTASNVPAGGQPQNAGGFLGTPAESQLVKEWAIFVAGLFGLAGLGMGLQFFVFNIIDEEIVSISADGVGQFAGAFLALSLSLLAFAFSAIGIGFAVVLGSYLGWNLDVADDLAYKAAAICSFVGAFLMLFLSAFLMGTAIDNLSVEIGGLVMNAIGVGIVAAAVAAGGVWFSRNNAPSSYGSDVESRGPVDVQPSD